MFSLDTEAGQTELTTAMLNAVEQAYAGFYFEEGGCWGMAKALHAKFAETGLRTRAMYRPKGFVHAWVQFSDRAIDYQGASLAPKDSLEVKPEALAALAESYGIDADQFESDVLWATEIVDNAWAQASKLSQTVQATGLQSTELATN